MTNLTRRDPLSSEWPRLQICLYHCRRHRPSFNWWKAAQSPFIQGWKHMGS